MVMLDRAIIVLVVGVLAQSILRRCSPTDGAWREDLAAEVRLAEALLKAHVGDELLRGGAAGDGLAGDRSPDPVLVGAVENVRRRLELVRVGLAERDASGWLGRFLSDVSSFQGHATWLRQWRQEWAERLKSSSASAVAGLPPASAGEAQEELSSDLHGDAEQGTCSLGDGAAACPAAASRDSAAPDRPEGRQPPAGDDAPGRPAKGRKAQAPADATADVDGDFPGGDEAEGSADFEAMQPVLQEVLQMMQREPTNAVMQERGCETLRYLAVDEASRVAIAGKDGIQAVLRAMRENANAADVQGYCCGTLTHLAATPRNRVAIFSKKGLQAVLKAMRTHLGSNLVQYKGCAALANLAVSDVEQAKVAKLGGAKAALRAMDVHLQDATVLEHCLGALNNLASSEENRPNITAAGADKSLQKVMKKNPGSSEVQRLAGKLRKLLKG